MRIVYFTHSLDSCWNHGNAHFQRGLLRALSNAGHDVLACEPAEGWSRRNLLIEAGEDATAAARGVIGATSVAHYAGAQCATRLASDADVIIVHEWTDDEIVTALAEQRRKRSATLLFHDTHHRAVSDPDSLPLAQLEMFDGVLAFGASLAEVYRRGGWGRRAFILHEAADVHLFHPLIAANGVSRSGLVWIGNWGDEERSAEIEEFLLRPASRSGSSLDVFGVRYPAQALNRLQAFGARYRGWIANLNVPVAFSRYAATVHIPRRPYREALPGIPTIRIFEALACGIPLVSAPWDDVEGLFRPGQDYLIGKDGEDMQRHFKALQRDSELADAVTSSGLERIRAHHTCEHRAEQLLSIIEDVRGKPAGVRACA